MRVGRFLSQVSSFHELRSCAMAPSLLLLMSCGGSLMSCGGSRPPQVSERPVGAIIKICPPLGLPQVPIPEKNPVTAEAVALGRRLFYEAKLSADSSLSCATCHNPGKGFAD